MGGSNSNFVECPPSEYQSRITVENNTPEPLWCNAPILPAGLLDLLATHNVIQNFTENEEDANNDELNIITSEQEKSDDDSNSDFGH